MFSRPLYNDKKYAIKETNLSVSSHEAQLLNGHNFGIRGLDGLNVDRQYGALFCGNSTEIQVVLNSFHP